MTEIMARAIKGRVFWNRKKVAVTIPGELYKGILHADTGKYWSTDGENRPFILAYLDESNDIQLDSYFMLEGFRM